MRTLTTLVEHHAELLASGSVSANAKKYFNVVRPCILPVPIEDACIPALHLDLCILPHLYDCILADTRSLDMQLDQSSYPTYVQCYAFEARSSRCRGTTCTVNSR